EQPELVADVVESVDAGDQVEITIRTPGPQRRFHEPQVRQVSVGPMEHPDQIHSDDVDIQALGLSDPGGLDQCLARATTEVKPGDRMAWKSSVPQVVK